jgi:glutathione S-transferase
MDIALHWFAICTVVLFFKMLALSFYQGYHRIGKASFKVPEDARLMGRTALTEELPQVQRAARAWMNDLENIPIFLFLGLIYMLVEAPGAVAPALFLIFTAARILHTVFYLTAMQPWRTIAYGVGLACLLWMSVGILLTLL